MEDLNGLDELDEHKCIYISHNGENHIYKIVFNEMPSNFIRSVIESDSTVLNNINNVIKISYGTSDALKFILTYLDFYKFTVEFDEPEIPIPSDIKDVFAPEYILFKDFIEYVPEDYENHLKKLVPYLNMTHYMDMPKLYKKLVAIFAWIQRNSNTISG